MKLTKYAACLLAASLLSASALPTAAADTKMTVEQVIIVGNALAALDGYEDTCRDGGTEKQCHRNYKFGGGARITIALDLAECRRVIQAYQSTLAALKAQYQGPESAARLEHETRQALDAPADVRLGTLRREDLKLDDNPIPVTVLSAVLPIVEN